jgi:ribonuclease D
MKPIVQQIFVRGKKLLNRDLTPYELQIYFAFQKEDKLKKVAKLLARRNRRQRNSDSIKSFIIKNEAIRVS